MNTASQHGIKNIRIHKTTKKSFHIYLPPGGRPKQSSTLVPIVEKEEENESMEDVAKRMFEILDDDHSGAVTTSEFKETLEKMGVFMSYEEVRELFHEYDDDLDGLMDEEEFVNMMTHQL